MVKFQALNFCEILWDRQKDLQSLIEQIFFMFEPLKMYVCYGATYHSSWPKKYDKGVQS